MPTADKQKTPKAPNPDAAAIVVTMPVKGQGGSGQEPERDENGQFAPGERAKDREDKDRRGVENTDAGAKARIRGALPRPPRGPATGPRLRPGVSATPPVAKLGDETLMGYTAEAERDENGLFLPKGKEVRHRKRGNGGTGTRAGTRLPATPGLSAAAPEAIAAPAATPMAALQGPVLASASIPRPFTPGPRFGRR